MFPYPEFWLTSGIIFLSQYFSINTYDCCVSFSDKIVNLVPSGLILTCFDYSCTCCSIAFLPGKAGVRAVATEPTNVKELQ